MTIYCQAWGQALTDCLDGGNPRYRLCQEAILGLGDMAMLGALGYGRVQAYHMNKEQLHDLPSREALGH